MTAAVRHCPDPWEALGHDWPKIRVYVRYMPDKWGQTIWDGDRPRIELAHDLGPVQQRCTLAHELHHLEFGRSCTSFCSANEREVVEATARWLLPDLERIGELLADHDVVSAARELEVTRQVLIDRLCSLSEREEEELARLLKPETISISAAQSHVAVDANRRSALASPQDHRIEDS